MGEDLAEGRNYSMEMFRQRSSIRRLYVITGILVLAIGSLLLGAYGLDMRGTHSDSFRFISLLILFMTALVVTATVFSGLQLGDRGEAFGLPSGSIRALLAIGLMILFVVFGLPLILPQKNDAGGASSRVIAENIAIPYEQRDAVIQRYTQQNMIVIPIDYGAPTTGVGTAQAVVRDAHIKLMTIDDNAARIDFGKQLITAIITLLTSVVSFYFGSRSATDAMKPGTQTDTASLDLAIHRKELAARFETFKQALLARAKTIDEAKALPDADNPADAEARRAAAAAVDARRKALETQSAGLQTLLTAIDQAIAGLAAAAPPDARAVNEKDAKDNLLKAKDMLAAAEVALPAYDTEIATYVKASAQG
jgi:hypothetical protein